MSPFVRFLLGLMLVFGLADSVRAQNLVVATNTLETGAQTYTFGEITNGATYTLSGAGAVLNMGTGTFYVGTNGTSARGVGNLIVTNGAVFNQTSGSFIVNSDGSLSKTSMVLISGAAFTNSAYMSFNSVVGAHSLIINNGSKALLAGGDISSGNGYFEISGGSKVLSSGRFRLSYNAYKEYMEMLVTGSGTSLFITNAASNTRGIQLGGYGSAKLTISDGALVTNRQGASFGVWNSSTYTPGAMTGWLNVVSGGVFSNGYISQGGIQGINFGNIASSVGGGVGIGLVAGTGSVLHTTGTISVNGNTNALGQFVYRSSLVVSNGGFAGANGVDIGVGDVLVTGGGTLDSANSLIMTAGFTGTLSNLNGGILQFNVAAPTITTNDRRIVVSDSVVSFRDRSDAPVVMTSGLSNMTYLGANSLQLYNSSNASGLASYTFSTNLGAYNWAGLRLTGATSGWRSATVRFDTNASLLITNTFATVVGVVTNSGAINVVNASATFASNVVLNSGSSYTSKNSTNTFSGGLQILSGANYNLDALSLVSGGITNNGLFNVLNGAAYTISNGNFLAGSGAFQVNMGGQLNLSNGLFALGNALTNNGLMNVLGGTTFRPNDGTGLAGSGVLQISANGLASFTNGGYTVGNAVSNSGTINVVNSKVTYIAPVVISGLYRSDPSTNTFATNVTVTASGALQGSNGDLFVFGGNLLNQSTNRSGFNLWQAAVLFTNLAAGGTNHTYDVTGSGSANWGTGFTNFDRVSTNFAIGTLSIAPGNRLMITGQVGGGITNAVYVGLLDIQGIDRLTLGGVTNGLFAALNLTDINVYYSREDPGNAWLNEFIPDTGYSLWGGSLLLPIPEPSAFAAIAAGLGLLAFLRRRV